MLIRLCRLILEIINSAPVIVFDLQGNSARAMDFFSAAGPGLGMGVVEPPLHFHAKAKLAGSARPARRNSPAITRPTPS